MDPAASAAASFTQAQLAMSVISNMALTSYLFSPQPTVSDSDEWDIIVVGAGSAGSVVASRLSEDPNNKVLLIEAGDAPPPESILPNPHLYMHQSHVDWNYTTKDDGYTHQTQKNKVMSLTRGKMIGGTGAINFMMYVRGNPKDYDDWAEVTGDESWNWENVLPYFIKSERLEDEEVLNSPNSIYHGTDGYLGVTREPHPDIEKYITAFTDELGHKRILDSNGYNTTGWCDPMVTIADGIRQSTAYAFLSPNKNRSNLQILRNTYVTKVLLDDDKTAIGVQVITEDNETISLSAKKRVVLSAGTLSSPLILMRSGIGPRDHLEEMGIECLLDLPVGENFHDHPAILFSMRMKNITPTVDPTNPTKLSIPLMTGYMSLDEGSTPDYQVPMVVCQDASVALLMSLVFMGYNNDISNKIYEAALGYETTIGVLNILKPDSRGRVLLSSTDPTAKPLVISGFFSNDTDVQNFIKYYKHAKRVLDTPTMKEAGAEIVDPFADLCTDYESGTDEYLRCYVLNAMGNIYHYVGTCAMGMVTNPDMSVMGTNRLSVIDASAMPIITSGNTYAPTIMMGEKGADYVKAALASDATTSDK